MSNLKNILAISGSTRTQSTNLLYIQAITQLAADYWVVNIFEGLTGLPHFNPDLDTQTPPAEVMAFRSALKACDGILICTPEYAMGVPGTLKNAIDWTVSSMEFSSKPVALVTASSVGEKGHASLLATLEVIEARMTSETQLLIPFAKTKISNEGIIQDDATLQEVKKLIDGLNELLGN